MNFSVGDESRQIKLISGEGKEFALDYRTIKLSKTLALLLDPKLGFLESQTGIIHLRDINTAQLERVVAFLNYRRQYDGADDYPPFPISPEESVDLLLVADYLDV